MPRSNKKHGARASFIKFSQICVFFAVLSSGAVHAEGVSYTSKKRAACEKLLIWSGLYTPPVRAQIRTPDPETLESIHFVRVTRPGREKAINYSRTDRNTFDIQYERYYPLELIKSQNLKGKKVLDLACGDGALVEELRRKEIDIVGLDVYLNQYQKSKPYFIQTPAEDTGLRSGSFDVIISTQGPLTYEFEDQAYAHKVLTEVHRLLKKGGSFIISPINVNENWSGRPQDASIETMLKGTVFLNLPKGLRIKRAPTLQWLLEPAENNRGEYANYWLEIERVD